jgi:hypothetical protein
VVTTMASKAETQVVVLTAMPGDGRRPRSFIPLAGTFAYAAVDPWGGGRTEEVAAGTVGPSLMGFGQSEENNVTDPSAAAGERSARRHRLGWLAGLCRNHAGVARCIPGDRRTHRHLRGSVRSTGGAHRICSAAPTPMTR